MRSLFRTAAETARLLGLTVKALRVYERHGLVRPQRTAAGWRVYGPDELLRLHQVVWLKRFGLQLAQIKLILQDRSVDLDKLLALQEEDLIERKRSVDQALRLVRKARAKLALGEPLSPEELIALTKETAMTRETPDWVKKMAPHVDRHLSEADKEEIRTRKHDSGDGDWEWERLIAEAKSLLGTDPGAPAALGLARRWNEQVAVVTGGDSAVRAKLRAVWQDALADPQTAPSLPITPEVMNFIKAASAKLEEQRSGQS